MSSRIPDGILAGMISSSFISKQNKINFREADDLN